MTHQMMGIEIRLMCPETLAGDMEVTGRTPPPSSGDQRWR